MNRRAIVIILAAFLTVFTAFAVRYSYGMLLPKMLPTLAISKTEAGVIFGAYFIAYTIFSPLLGLLADRYDIRVILTSFVAILGTGAFLMSLASSVMNASLFFTIAGIGHSACWVPVVALVQRWVSDRRRGTAFAVVDLGSALAIAVWSIAMPFIVAISSWRAGWMSLGVFAFLVAGMNYLLVRSHPEENPGPENPTQDGLKPESIRVIYSRLFHDIKLWLVGLSYLLVAFTVIVPFTFLSTYATQELTMPYGVSTRLLAVIGITGIAGKLLLSMLSDSLGRIRIMMLCGALLAIGCLGIAYSKGLSTLILFTGVFGFGYGALWPVYAASAPDYFSTKYVGSVVGLWTLFLGVGSVISPILSGWTIDKTGSYTPAFVLAVTSAAISLLLLVPMLKASPVESGKSQRI